MLLEANIVILRGSSVGTDSADKCLTFEARCRASNCESLLDLVQLDQSSLPKGHRPNQQHRWQGGASQKG